MRVIMGLSHLHRIINALPEGGRMLEWGSGGSTVWFADRLPAGAELISVDHDREWHGKVAECLRGRLNVRLVLSEPTGPLGRNATIEEEDVRPLRGLVHAADEFAGDRKFDVILVDGYARGACLRHAGRLLAPGGVVFLHDAQRPWYDDAKQSLTMWGNCGSCSDYRIPHLWWGGVGEVRAIDRRAGVRADRGVGRLPVIVSSYTSGTAYEQDAARLIESCDALGLEHDVREVPPQPTWEAACAKKASFIAERMREHDRPVLWVDADAVMRGVPELLRKPGVDTAFCVYRGEKFASGTVYFAPTPMGELLLGEWCARCEAEPDVWDQVHLELAWERVSREHPLSTMWLPERYLKIFDDERTTIGEPVIEQFQASRRLLRARPESEFDGVPTRSPFMQQLDASYLPARRAGRIREVEPPAKAGPVLFGAAVDTNTMPDGVKRLLVDRAALACVSMNARRIAIYGGGHVAATFGLSSFTSRGLEIVAVLSDMQAGGTSFDLPVCHPLRLREMFGDVDAVVVMTDRFERKLAAHARAWLGEQMPVVRLFEPELEAERAWAAGGRFAGAC